MNALLIEDAPEVATIIQLALRRTGLQIIHVVNGVQALDYVALNRPDLIIVDIGLPGMNGWQVLDQMKNNPNAEDVPVIVLTAHADTNSRKTGALYKVDAFLTKPVMPEVIRETVMRVLEVD
jgi:DNA-binding response OmpR family regulator